MIRKTQSLAKYTFEIYHIDGRSNDTADFPSRYLYRGIEASTQTLEETLWKQFKTLVMEDGLLKKKWFEVGIKKSKTLVIVPEMIREEVMEKTHNSILTGHPGVEISYLTCRKDFYWPRMRDDFELYVAACTVGSSVKQPQAYSRVKHILYMIYHQFNDCVLIDCAYQDGTNSEG